MQPRSASPSTREQRTAARRLTRPAAAPAQPTPAIRKPAPPSRPRGVIRGGGSTVPTILSVTERYTAEGWRVLIVPAGSQMDFIAVRDSRMHFVKIILADVSASAATNTPTSTPTPAVIPTGQRNQFIQNAMSNSAEPIFAMPDGSLVNTNEDRRAVITRRGGAAASASSGV